MQNFLLAQAVVEHSILSSITSGINSGTYRLQMFISEMTVTQMVVGLGVVVLLLLLWRR